MKKRFYLFITLLCFLSVYATESQIKDDTPSVFFMSGVGIGYDLDFGSNFIFASTENRALFDVPLFFEVDVRLNRDFSIGTGIQFIYNLHYYFRSNVEYYRNSLFIDIPVNFRYYPMAKIDPSYSSFYIGAGAFVRFWAVNAMTYYGDGYNHSANVYDQNQTDLSYPSQVYSPANIGLSVFLGNRFAITNRVGLGLDFFFKATLIPNINGYWSTPNTVDSHGNVPLSFWADVGAKFFVSVELTEPRYGIDY